MAIEIVETDASSPPDQADQLTSVLPDDIRESIALGSFTSISGQPSSLSNLAYGMAIGNTNLSQQNAVSNQQAMNQLGVTAAGKTVNGVANLSPLEAVAVVKLDTGNDIAEQLADLKAVIGGGTPTPTRLPRVRRNPAGGSFITVTEKSFPLTLIIRDAIRKPFVARGRNGGLVAVLKPSNFPFDLTFDRKPSEPKTVMTVPMKDFPFTIKIGAHPQAVGENKFPLRVLIGLLNE
jgi:hypothetical protein